MGPGGGDNNMNEGTSFQPSEPIPCSNGCGFFGTPATNNLCSKCFRDFQMKEESALAAKAAFEKFSKTVAPPPEEKKPFNFAPGKGKPMPEGSIFPFPASNPTANPTFGADPSILPLSSPDSPAGKGIKMFGNGAGPSIVKKPSAATNRCGCCNKKVGVMGFACRCGITFCGTHRYPESHECSFDFKAQGREAIAKANPVVKGDKIQRF